MKTRARAVASWVVLLWWVPCGTTFAQPTAPPPCPVARPYGNDAQTGAFATVNGQSLYYEIHGSGPPLLVIHGNGGSINGLRCQIAHFSRSRRVIAADSRSHGRSSTASGRLTYEQIADDLAALLKELRIDSTDVVGHSDGGIVALLLAIRHPGQVSKVVSSSANLRPDDTALFPWYLERVRTNARTAREMMTAGDTTQDWGRRKQQLDLMLEEPHISASALQQIAAPVLVMAADADIMPLTHTHELFAALPRAHLVIVPGATHNMHMAEFGLYNALAERFLDRPFVRPQPPGQPAQTAR